MNEDYQHNVNHIVKPTPKYGKVSCATTGCTFDVWYLPKEAPPNENSEYVYFRATNQQHNILAHLKER